MAVKKEPKFKLPRSLAACADLYYNLRAERLAQQNQAKGIQEREGVVREHLINSLPKSDSTGIAGKVARVSVYTTPALRLEDWDKFLAFVIKTEQWHLLGRTFSEAAVAELLEQNKKLKKVPGIGKFNIVKLSFNKL